MSPYGYDYSLAPSAPTGRRSRLATVMTVSAIVAISAISGAAVALNLLGPAGTTADRPVAVATHALPAKPPVAQPVTPAMPQPANVSATVAPSRVPAAVSAPPAQSVPAVAVAEVPPAPHVADSDLTFSRGYARRRAIQAAADVASHPQAEMARVETQGQLGRSARVKPKAVANATVPADQRRIAETRSEGSLFNRFDQHEKFDFGRHQALAFGDSRDPRAVRRPPPQGGGLFGNSPSGFFGGLF